MGEVKTPIKFVTSSDSINAASGDYLQEDILESTFKDNKHLRDRCTELESQLLQKTKESNVKDKTIKKMQSSAGQAVGYGNKK